MRKQSLFSKERTVYWPDEFSDIMNFLTGKDADGKTISSPVYSFNTGAIVFAAAIGVSKKRKRDIGASSRKEISTTTFASHGLESYIFLIPLLGNPTHNLEIFRPDVEEELIKEFERYAAGGLEYLRGEFAASPLDGADLIVEKLFKSDARSGSTKDIPDLI